MVWYSNNNQTLLAAIAPYQTQPRLMFRQAAARDRHHLFLLISSVFFFRALALTTTTSRAAFYFPPSSLTSSSLLRNQLADETMTTNAAAPHLSPSTLTNLVELTISFAAANGLQVEVATAPPNKKKTYITAPISLLPQSYPRNQFNHGVLLSRPFNILVDRISRHGKFLQETLRDVRDVDQFTGMLLHLYEDIYLSGDSDYGYYAKSADRLGILRSDYMLHRCSSSGGGESGSDREEYSLKQVELNTIASSFAGLASTVAKLHGFLINRMADNDDLIQFLEENVHAVIGNSAADDISDGEGEFIRREVPKSLAMIRLPAAMAVTYERYRTRFNINNDSSSGNDNKNNRRKLVILFVVQPNETNTVDQRLLEFALWDNHEIPVVRMSLGEIYKRVCLDEMSGRLTIIPKNDEDGDGSSVLGGGLVQEVAVVYFRAGYAPTDYPSGYNTKDGSGIEWLARERLERGCAAKCPNLGYHLAGTKKVQQELARRGAVEQFFPNIDGDDDDEADVASKIRTAFAGLYSLGTDANEEDMEAVKDVLFNNAQSQYVLKPQREGGGYNYYGEDLANKLKENCTISGEDNNDMMLSPSLSEFILMERLFPPQQRAILLRNGHVEGTGMSISELGCFGAIVASGDGEVVHNEYAGFLLRTKFSGVDEGGVASGFATLSSPFLC